MTRDPNEVEPGRYYTVDEVAYYFRSTPKRIVRLIDDGKIQGMLINRSYLVKGRAILTAEELFRHCAVESAERKHRAA
jgi:regulator of extracellular matrix RemA (YlzA/DUF370 family)